LNYYGVSLHSFSCSREMNVLFSGYSQTLPNYQVGPHTLDYYLVHFVLEGKGAFISKGQKYELKVCDCFFILPGEQVEYSSDPIDPWTYQWIGFRGNEADTIMRELAITAESPIVDTAANKTILALFRDIQKALQNGGRGSELKAGGYLRQLFGEFADILAVSPILGSLLNKDPKWAIDSAMHWLTSQYHRPLSMNELANEIGYHRSYLSRAFKKATGRTLSHFLLNLRMERARSLLLESFTIAQIASLVGFEDPLYFSKIFKKWHGCPPTHLRGKRFGMERFQPK